MKILNGIDLIEIQRIEKSINRYGDRFLQRIFTENEITLCNENTASLAARFAGKEAVSKVFKTGIGNIQWTEIEILRDPQGAPELILHGQAKEKSQAMQITSWSISLSHTAEHAIAIATALSDETA